jgi:plastocyanin
VRRFLLAVCAVAALAAPSSAGAATTAVSITKSGFSPANVTIVAGDSVTWTNRDTANHQVNIDNNNATSPVLKPGQSWTYTFTKPDFYAYRDKLRETTRGSVTVTGPGQVIISQLGFAPKTITVGAGDTVTWTNRDSRGGSHQVVADDGSFSSPVLKPGATYSHTFENAGTFSYHDGLHPSLTAKVVVGPGAPVALILYASRRTVISGGSVTLNGSVAGARPGDSVVISAKPVGLAERTIVVTVAADGSFSVRVVPRIGTTYQAFVRSAQSTTRGQSSTVTIGVRPRVTLRRTGHGRFSTVVVAANPLGGAVVSFTRWVPRRHAWVTMARARLHATRNESIFSTTFRTRLRHQKLRVFISQGQAGPGYLAGYSNFVVS